MGVFSMLTTNGLNQINNADPESGIFIQVTHWVGVFDQQLEIDYEAGSPDANNIANYTSPSDLAPQDNGGQIYWKTTPSDVNDPSKGDLFTGVTYSPVSKFDPTKLQGCWIVGDPYPTGATKGDWWYVSGSGEFNGITYNDNGNPCDPGADILLWNGIAWQNAGASLDGDYRANFRVRVTADPDKPTEVLKVNKVAIYAITRSVDGILQDDPFLLGQVIIPDTQTVVPRIQGQSDNFAVDELVIDFQIDTAAISTDFDNIIYASENDYWYRLPYNGLGFDGQVYIAQSVGIEDQHAEFPNSDIGVGKLLVATNETINDESPDREALMPQLVLQYNKRGTFANIDNGGTGGTNYTQRARTTFWTSPDGDCEIDMYGSCSNDFGYYSLVPKEDRVFGLGNDSNRWKSVKASELFELYLGEANKVQNGGVINDDGFAYGWMTLGKNTFSDNTDLGLARFANSSVMVGPYFDPEQSESQHTNYYYTYGNISNYIMPDGSPGFDLVARSTNDIHLFNISDDYMSPNEFGEGVGQGGQQTAHQIWELVGNGGYATSDGFVQGVVQSEFFKKFYDISNFPGTDSFGSDVDNLRISTYGDVDYVVGDGSPNGEGINKDIIITAQRYLLTNGDYIPLIDGYNNIGSSDHGFRELYVGVINGSARPETSLAPDYGGWNLLEIDADIVPVEGSASKKITRNLSGQRFQRIDCGSLGSTDDYIDAGYITNIAADTLNVRQINIGSNVNINETSFNSNTPYTIGDPEDLNKFSFFGKVVLDFSTKYKTLEANISDLSLSDSGKRIKNNSLDGDTKISIEVKYSITSISGFTLTLTGGSWRWTIDQDNMYNSGDSASTYIDGLFQRVLETISDDSELSGLPLDWDKIIGTLPIENNLTDSGDDRGDYKRKITLGASGGPTFRFPGFTRFGGVVIGGTTTESIPDFEDRVAMRIENKTFDKPSRRKDFDMSYTGYLGFVGE